MAPSVPKSYKAVLLDKANTDLHEIVVDVKKPQPGWVLAKVLACGICHTDDFVKGGFLPMTKWPIVLGHEVVGDIVEVGEGVTRLKVGERVGGGWHGGHDGTCRSCMRGTMQTCENAAVNGVTMDGGYGEYVYLRQEACARIPDGADPAETAPLLCAGVTVYNAMRHMNVQAGNICAVQGLGGLGHLAVQYARAMGYRVVALSHGADKESFARKLGAHEYVDTSKDDPVERLNAMGGAALICSTAPNPKAISPLVGGLQPMGKLLVLAPVGPVEFDTAQLIMKGASVHGWPSGHTLDEEEAIAFSQTHGVRCMVEKFPLKDFQKAYDHMLSGKARFRVVLIPEN